MARAKYDSYQELHMTKEQRENLKIERKKSTLRTFDNEFIESINPRNKNLLYDFMTFISYSNMAKKTCQNMKNNLILFFKWNRDWNNNLNFRFITKEQGEQFFIYIKNLDYTYIRSKCIKSDICSLADFAEFVIGKDEYHHNGMKNQWYTYHHEWREVVIPYDINETGYLSTNYAEFSFDRLDTLEKYLVSVHDYMGMMILHLVPFGYKMLFFQIDSVDINLNHPTVKKYMKWREREGVNIPDVLVVRRPDGTYVPMSLPELRDYAKMFSVFLGKELIIC